MPLKTWNVEITFEDESTVTAEVTGPHATIEDVGKHLKETRKGVKSVAEVKPDAPAGIPGEE